MRVLILGGDGYLGWPTAMYLSRRGVEVALVDNYFRRQACSKLDRPPLIQVPDLNRRAAFWEASSGQRLRVEIGDVCDYPFLLKVFRQFAPEAVIHYAEQPAAPYSMMGHQAGDLHPHQQSGVHGQPDLCGERVQPRLSPDQAGNHGGLWHSQY